MKKDEEFSSRKFSKPLLTIVYSYVIIAIGAIIYSIIHFNYENLHLIFFPSVILFVLRRWPIRYYLKENHIIFFTFSFPILIIFGPVPVIFSNVMYVILPDKQPLLIKKMFNAANNIIAATTVFYLLDIINQRISFHNPTYIIVIVLIAFIYATIQGLGLSTVVFFETRAKFNFHSHNNILITNTVNGIITFYLYQSLGLIGLCLAIAYSLILSYRSRYLEELVTKKGELAEAENRFRKVFNTIEYGIIMLDINKRVKMANAIAMNFLATKDKNPIGKEIVHLIPDYPIEVFNMINWTYENKRNDERRKVSILSSNEIIYLDLYTYPYNISANEFAGIIIVYKNVTDEQLIRRQLIEADKLSHIGQIAAGKVHEIKNPLTTVRGYLQFLRQKVAKGEDINMNYFDIALQEIDRTNDLISSLLILSKQPNQEFKPVVIEKILHEIIQLFSHQINVKNITLTTNIRKDLSIIGVENYLKQIFINLILNAIDAVEKRDVRKIAINAFEEHENVVIQVVDNGKGIKEEDIKRLSLPFFTTKSSGTGLGLSVTYKLVEDHGGNIRVESTEGQGTSFILSFIKNS